MAQFHYNVPVFIPQAGCPFQCVFCNQNRISGAAASPGPEQIKAEIDKCLDTIPGGAETQIAFFGGSFTGLPMSEQEEYLKIAADYIQKGLARSVRISTRPDYIDKPRLALLKSYGVTDIELGAQSLDDDVLRRSGRGHTAADAMRASELIRSEGFSLGLQMMIGLPGDTREKSMKTGRAIIDAGAHSTRIYPALVIRETRMERWYAQGKYKPLDLQEAVEWSAELMEMFEKAGVRTLRVGLHPSEGLLSGENLVAGPFHVSFRELVLSEIWRARLSKLSHVENTGMSIYVRPSEINYAIGYKSCNRNRLLERFQSVLFKPDSTLTGRDFYVDYH